MPTKQEWVYGLKVIAFTLRDKKSRMRCMIFTFISVLVVVMTELLSSGEVMSLVDVLILTYAVGLIHFVFVACTNVEHYLDMVKANLVDGNKTVDEQIEDELGDSDEPGNSDE